MSARILFVDDEPNVLVGLRRSVGRLWEVDIAPSGAAALSAVRDNPPYAVIVVDQNMPGLTGIDVLGEIARTSPNTVRIMLSGNADQKTAVAAVNEGRVFRYLSKPCPEKDLIHALTLAIAQFEFATSRQDLLEKTLAGALGVLTDVFASADPVAFGQAQRIRGMVNSIATFAKYEGTWQIEVGAMLAHIGILSVPPNVASKAKLGHAMTEQERELVHDMPKLGADLIRRIPYLEPVADIVLYQDKRFNGEGFPDDDVAGEAIPFGSRVIKVLRDMDRLVQESGDKKTALKTLYMRRGWYDPRILDDAFRLFAAETHHLGAAQVIQIAPRCLRLGQVLAIDLKSTDGRVLVEAGTEVTPLVHSLVLKFANLDELVLPLHVFEDPAA
jgi:response regulator RpfG family c-di-GMP phosphodiesterase